MPYPVKNQHQSLKQIVPVCIGISTMFQRERISICENLGMGKSIMEQVPWPINPVASTP